MQNTRTRSLAELEAADAPAWTPDELAAVLRHRPRTIRDWIRRGLLTSVRTSDRKGRHVISHQAVRRFVLERMRRPETTPPAA
jgi:hypothetical protein